MSNFAEGQKVKVVGNTLGPESDWVGVLVIIERIHENYIMVKAVDGENYPEYTKWFVDGDTAYFTHAELEAV